MEEKNYGISITGDRAELDVLDCRTKQKGHLRDEWNCLEKRKKNM